VNIVFIITGAFIALIGLAIKHLQLYDLIAGYNTMPPGEKAAFNIEKFALLMRNAFTIIGLFIIIGALLSIWLKIEFLGLVILFAAMIIGLTWLISKGQQLEKSETADVKRVKEGMNVNFH